VLDIALAGPMDGWDLLIHLKTDERLKHIPVIICSVLDSKFKSQQLGAAEFLPKPIDARKLDDLINRLTAVAPQRNILIIDDDASLRRMLKETLSAHDYVVATAAGGEQGLKLAAQIAPDLIILDLMMPKMDGFQVLSRLRTNRRTINIPVIIISAKELSNEERAFLQDGMALFLTKGDHTAQDIREAVRNSLLSSSK
jgi:CheY-like chemotaxis protein